MLSNDKKNMVGVNKASIERHLDAYAEYIPIVHSVWVGILDSIRGDACAGAVCVLEVASKLLVDNALGRRITTKTRRQVGLREEHRGQIGALSFQYCYAVVQVANFSVELVGRLHRGVFGKLLQTCNGSVDERPNATARADQG